MQIVTPTSDVATKRASNYQTWEPSPSRRQFN